MEAEITHDGGRMDCCGSDLNRRVGCTQLGEVRLGAKPDCLCLVGVELQATASAPEISVGRAVRQACLNRVDVNAYCARLCPQCLH